MTSTVNSTAREGVLTSRTCKDGRIFCLVVQFIDYGKSMRSLALRVQNILHVQVVSRWTASDGTFRNPVPHPRICLGLSNRLHVRHRRTDFLNLGGTEARHPSRFRSGNNTKVPLSLLSPHQSAKELEQLDRRLCRTRLAIIIYALDSIWIYARSSPSPLLTRSRPSSLTTQTSPRVGQSGGRHFQVLFA